MAARIAGSRSSAASRSSALSFARVAASRAYRAHSAGSPVVPPLGPGQVIARDCARPPDAVTGADAGTAAGFDVDAAGAVRNSNASAVGIAIATTPATSTTAQRRSGRGRASMANEVSRPTPPHVVSLCCY
jgi:hypothetical protein